MGKPNPFCRPQSRPGESLTTTTTTTTVSPEDIFVIPASGASCPKVDDTVTTTTVSPGDDVIINLPCVTTTSTTTTTTVPGTPTNQNWYLKYTAPYNGFINNIVRHDYGNTHIASLSIDYGDITPASNDQPKSLILTSLNNANSWSSRSWPYYISNNTISTVPNFYEGGETIFIMHNDKNPNSDEEDIGLFFRLLDKKDWYGATANTRTIFPSKSYTFSCFIESIVYNSLYQRYSIYGAGIDKYGNILKIDNYLPISYDSYSYDVEIIASQNNEPFIFGTVSQNRASLKQYLISNGNHCLINIVPSLSVNGLIRSDWPIYSFSACHNGNYWIAVGKRSQISNEQICAISYDDGENWSIISTITNNTTLYTSLYGLSNLVLINGGLYCFSETRMYRSFNGGFNWDSVALPENGGAFPAIAADTGNTGKIVVGIKNKIYTYE